MSGCLIVSLSHCLLVSASASAATPLDVFLDQRCTSCHDNDVQKGGLNLTTLPRDLASEAARERWVQVFDRVTAGEMPPKDKKQPTVEEKSAFLTSLGAAIQRFDVALKGTQLRRLNRSEYENTLRDLLGVPVEVKELLPEDSRDHGFDNIGSALAISAVQMRRYMEAATVALNEACPGGEKPAATKKTYTLAENDKGQPSGALNRAWMLRGDGAVVVYNDGLLAGTETMLQSFKAPLKGRYRIRFQAQAHRSDTRIAFGVYLGTRKDQRQAFYFSAPVEKPSQIDFTAVLDAGDGLKFIPTGPGRFPYNPTSQIKKANGNIDALKDRGLALFPIEIEGPFFDEWPPRGQKLLFGDLKATSPAKLELPKNEKSTAKLIPAVFSPQNALADARKLLPGFLSAAFRRGPIRDEIATPYLKLFEAELAKKQDFTLAMRTAALAALCSPDFLYLEEPPGPLDDHALASRLAYFLTRSTPDAELLSAKLTDAKILRQHTERLLTAPTLERFLADFTDSWLNLRDIESTSPDVRLYPEFDRHLQHSMLAETRGFLGHLIRENLSTSLLIQSDFALLDERLAWHYGIPGVEDSELRPVKLQPQSHRGGLLTHASILKVSANGTNTSPILRGVWVQERVLGFKPPPPPPGVPGLEPDIRGAKTLRQQLDQHRNLDQCRNCHAKIDPPGFALENYDVIGGWRENYRISDGDGKAIAPWDRQKHYTDGLPVDPSGEIQSVGSFNDLTTFQKLLLQHRRREVQKSFTEKLLTFACGRLPTFSDRPEIEKLCSKELGCRELVHAVVQSEMFRRK